MSHSGNRSLRGAGLALAATAAALAPTGSPASASSDDGAARAMPRDWVYAHTCGHLGQDCDRAARSLRVSIAPARAATGRTTLFRLQVLSRGRRAARAVISFSGVRVRTDARGRAVVLASPARAGRVAAVARSSTHGTGRAWVRVVG